MPEGRNFLSSNAVGAGEFLGYPRVSFAVTGYGGVLSEEWNDHLSASFDMGADGLWMRTHA